MTGPLLVLSAIIVPEKYLGIYPLNSGIYPSDHCINLDLCICIIPRVGFYGRCGEISINYSSFPELPPPPPSTPYCLNECIYSWRFCPIWPHGGGKARQYWWPPGPRPSSFKTAFVAKGPPAEAESWFSGCNGCHRRSPRHAIRCRRRSRSLSCQAPSLQLLHHLKLISPTATATVAMMTTAAAARLLSPWGIKARPPSSVFLVMSVASCQIK